MSKNLKSCTKLELLNRIGEMERLINISKEKERKALSKLEATKNEQFLFLFTINNMSKIYGEELTKKTSLFRTTLNVYDNVTVKAEHRKFPDGNRVIITYVVNEDKNTCEFRDATFFRRIKEN